MWLVCRDEINAWKFVSLELEDYFNWPFQKLQFEIFFCAVQTIFLLLFLTSPIFLSSPPLLTLTSYNSILVTTLVFVLLLVKTCARLRKLRQRKIFLKNYFHTYPMARCSTSPRRRGRVSKDLEMTPTRSWRVSRPPPAPRSRWAAARTAASPSSSLGSRTPSWGNNLNNWMKINSQFYDFTT